MPVFFGMPSRTVIKTRSRKASSRRFFAQVNIVVNDGNDRQWMTKETENLAILTGLEVYSAKSGIKPDSAEYIGQGNVSRKYLSKIPDEIMERSVSMLEVSCYKTNAIFINI